MPNIAVSRKTLTRKYSSLALVLMFAGFVSPSESQELQHYLDLSLDELMEIRINVASKVEEPISRSTSQVTVITEQDIARSGARNLMDLLRVVPGFFYYQHENGENSLGVRGAGNRTGAGLLLLLNGHVINHSRSGSATFQMSDRIPVENIQRIEIIKGPGSSVYGSNAYLGVINVISKTHLDNKPRELVLAYEGEASGSIANRANLLYSWEGSGSNGASLNIHRLNANGAEIDVDKDAVGKSGYVDNETEETDAQFNWRYKSFELKARGYDRDAGGFYGLRGELIEDRRIQHYGGFVDLAYVWALSPTLNISTTGYFDYANFESFVSLAGESGEVGVTEARRGAEVRMTYTGMDGHTFVLGASGLKERIYNPRKKTNEGNPGGPLVDTPSGLNWIVSGEREDYAIFTEDLWDLSPSVRLTLGARFDHYSDFGDTVNPRLGGFWQMNENFSARLSYATAFRAPDLESQLLNAPPFITGNPELEPEIVESTQLTISDRWSDRAWGNVTVYYNELEDLIVTSPADGTILNIGFLRTAGIEFERGYQFSDTRFLRFNASFLNAELTGGEEAGVIPRKSASIEYNQLFAKRFNWNISTIWQGKSERTPIDLREPLGAYYLLNTTLLIEKVFVFETLSVSVFNLADKDYYYPSLLGSDGVDYPAAGRSFVIAVKIKI